MINSPHFIYLFILNSELLSAVLSAVRRTTAHAIDVVLAEAEEAESADKKKQNKKKTPPRSESRTGEQTSSVWINTRKLPSRKAITCVNTDIHCNAPWRLISLCVCVSVYAKPGEEIKSFLLFLA